MEEDEEEEENTEKTRSDVSKEVMLNRNVTDITDIYCNSVEFPDDDKTKDMFKDEEDTKTERLVTIDGKVKKERKLTPMGKIGQKFRGNLADNLRSIGVPQK